VGLFFRPNFNVGFTVTSAINPKENFEASKIMGIINLSPDSFFPESRVSSVSASLKVAESMIEEGADYLDVGAESSRPGAKPISEEEELAIILPVIKQLCQNFSVPISVDTYKPGVAQKVLEEGVSIINDITGLRYPEMAPVIAEYDAGVIIMHMQGSPANMQENAHYDDCVREIKTLLEQGIQTAEAAGIASDRIWVDPGIGFGKTVKHNLEILANLDAFALLQKPILLGTSRKSFIGKILDLPVAERLEGSLATAVIGVLKGANILRVHDIRETYRAVKIASEILKVQDGK
jgi:dihydropteroate synthase